jgi:hypothetical protein
MATVTVTETGVAINVEMIRDSNGDAVKYSAMSITDVPIIKGREVMDADITSELTPEQLAVVASVLDFIEAKAKAAWEIP